MTGCCGLNCDQCEAFIATANNDDAMRARVAEDWAKRYHAPIQPEHINCTGCKSKGVKTYHCEHLCEIRKCAMGKSFGTCAECPDCGCGLLKPLLDASSQARQTLDALRRQ